MNVATHLNFSAWLGDENVKLSMNQAAILHACPVKQVDVSRALNISGAGISSAVDALAKRGLVYRTEDGDDRRIVVIVPTEKGELFAKSANMVLAGQSLEDAIAYLTSGGSHSAENVENEAEEEEEQDTDLPEPPPLEEPAVEEVAVV